MFDLNISKPIPASLVFFEKIRSGTVGAKTICATVSHPCGGKHSLVIRPRHPENIPSRQNKRQKKCAETVPRPASLTPTPSKSYPKEAQPKPVFLANTRGVVGSVFTKKNG